MTWFNLIVALVIGICCALWMTSTVPDSHPSKGLPDCSKLIEDELEEQINLNAKIMLTTTALAGFTSIVIFCILVLLVLVITSSGGSDIE